MIHPKEMLCTSGKEDSTGAQGFCKFLVEHFFGFVREIDHDITAGYEIKARLETICKKVLVLESDLSFDRIFNLIPFVRWGKILLNDFRWSARKIILFIEAVFGLL